MYIRGLPRREHGAGNVLLRCHDARGQLTPPSRSSDGASVPQPTTQPAVLSREERRSGAGTTSTATLRLAPALTSNPTHPRTDQPRKTHLVLHYLPLVAASPSLPSNSCQHTDRDRLKPPKPTETSSNTVMQSYALRYEQTRLQHLFLPNPK